jgi:molecular chaperone HscA
MDKKTAAVLIASLLERIERDQTIGAVSSLERTALQIALAGLQGEVGYIDADAIEHDGPVTTPQSGTGSAVSDATSLPISKESVDVGAKDGLPFSAPVLPTVTLALGSIQRDEVTDPEVLLCLDFGTAMSKAFAKVFPDKYLDLELGKEAGRQGYMLPSSVFIADDGKAYFGFEAIEQSQDLIDSGRERLDSIKGWLSLRREGNLDSEACVLKPTMNPSAYRLTEGDLIRIYLAYLTDIAENSLVHQGVNEPRYAKRRFARPCWPDPVQAKWADGVMRRMLAEAQILADTFTGRWEGGIPVGELKSAVEQIKALNKRPDYLIDDGVPEPVAVAASAIADSENARDAFMVVDVGAGTTDFGLFIATHRPNEENFRVFQVPASIQGLMQAGDKVDGLLRGFIARRESIDPSDNSGRMILADLSRRIRGLKEALFKTGRLEYVLADGTVGEIAVEEFLADERVERFAEAVENGFKKSLEAVDESWLRWLAMDGVRLNVVLTGGSSTLPMMQALGQGPIDVKGHRILRQAVDARPDWMADMALELQAVYPQLAVAIGGTAETLPETLTAPPVFGGGGARHHSYVASNLRISES